MPSVVPVQFPTRPISIPFRGGGLPPFLQRPFPLDTSLLTPGCRATSTTAFGVVRKNIITLKLGDGHEDEENRAPYSSACAPVPAWAPPPAHDGPGHHGAAAAAAGDDEEGAFPSCQPLLFHHKSSYSCPSPTDGGSGSSTATTAATSSTGSYVADSELDDCSTRGDGDASPASSLASNTDGDLMQDLVKEMERLFELQNAPFQMQCWEDAQPMAPVAQAV